MKLTVKVRAPAVKQAASIVRDHLQPFAPDAAVEEVFPEETTGKRAGLVVIDLPDDADLDRVLKRLRDDDQIEYAERSPTRARR